MTPEEFYSTVLTPALKKTTKFAPELTNDRSLQVLMMSISGQEANWTERLQDPSGLAHGLFQMQLNDIEDIMANTASADIFELGMKAWGVKTVTAEHLFELLTTQEGDSLSVFLARLNLWCNPNPLPAADDQQAQFEYYLNTWRPGAPVPSRWPSVYGQSLAVVPVQ
jgi:hypothetical protein